MSDIRTIFRDFAGDYSITGPQLDADDGLQTAVVISLFTDRRAEADDTLPAGTDRRGWWADAWPAVERDLLGSRLWLLDREKQLPEVVRRAREYAEEALSWLLEDGIARRVTVTAEVVRTGVLGLGVEIERPAGDAVSYRFDYLWNA